MVSSPRLVKKVISSGEKIDKGRVVGNQTQFRCKNQRKSGAISTRGRVASLNNGERRDDTAGGQNSSLRDG